MLRTWHLHFYPVFCLDLYNGQLACKIPSVAFKVTAEVLPFYLFLVEKQEDVMESTVILNLFTVMGGLILSGIKGDIIPL